MLLPGFGKLLNSATATASKGSRRVPPFVSNHHNQHRPAPSLNASSAQFLFQVATLLATFNHGQVPRRGLLCGAEGRRVKCLTQACRFPCGQIIKSNPRRGRGSGRRGGGARKEILGTKAAVPTPAQKARRAPVVATTPAAPQVAEKIIVSNLPVDVNEQQIRVSASILTCLTGSLTFSLH